MVRRHPGVAAPGSLTARYEALAGDEDERLELYVARSKLGYSIPKWRALPWWQRRVYVEGIQKEADQYAEASGQAPSGGSGVGDPVSAILGGTMGDVGSLGYDVAD